MITCNEKKVGKPWVILPVEKGKTFTYFYLKRNNILYFKSKQNWIATVLIIVDCRIACASKIIDVPVVVFVLVSVAHRLRFCL